MLFANIDAVDREWAKVDLKPDENEIDGECEGEVNLSKQTDHSVERLDTPSGTESENEVMDHIDSPSQSSPEKESPQSAKKGENDLSESEKLEKHTRQEAAPKINPENSPRKNFGPTPPVDRENRPTQTITRKQNENGAATPTSRQHNIGGAQPTPMNIDTRGKRDRPEEAASEEEGGEKQRKRRSAPDC